MNVIRGVSAGKVLVRMADMKASNQFEQEIVTHSLGSCLGIAVYDPEIRVGAMMHSLLPHSSLDPEKAQKAPFIFVNTGLPLLFRAVYELGAQRARLQIKVAGGADMMTTANLFNVGERNFKSLEELLTKNGFRLTGQSVGGHVSRTFRLNLAEGKATVESPGEEKVIL